MIHHERYTRLKTELEGASAPVLHEKSFVPEDMVNFLKTVRRMPYSEEWFLQDTIRLQAIYKKEYGLYFKKFAKDMKYYLELKKGYIYMKKLYEEERENERIMEELYV